jgi:general secretion pathway protein G
MIRRTCRAFTLIELLLVLVILAVLASVVVPLYVNRLKDARIKATITEIRELKTALAAFQVDTGRFPSTEEGLYALVEAPPDVAGAWQGRYIEQVTPDKWGNPYRYLCPSPTEPGNYMLFSCGPDGVEYTEDDITQYTLGTAATAGGQ